MNRHVRLSIATAFVAVLAFAGPMSASDLDPHGDANAYPISPVCERTGDVVTVAIANPTLLGINPYGFGIAMPPTWVAFYLQGYKTGNVGFYQTNGWIWYSSKGDGASPSYLTNYGNGVTGRSTTMSFSGTTPDYWGVWTLVQWPDGYQEWQAWTGWCYA